MGNSISTYSNIKTGGGDDDCDDSFNPESESLEKTLDYIASYYILTMDFQSLRKLYEKEYCEELIGLTSEIIDKHFNDLEVNKLAQRIVTGTKEDLTVFKNTDLNKFELKISDADKKQVNCIQIAKFYIKIAHIFSAIVTTVNPEYVYEDVNGSKVKRSLNQKNDIPTGAKISISKLNLCGERIDALKGSLPSTNTNAQPDICSINMDKNDLEDAPGIPELIDLYYDGDYDYKTGKFLGMTEATRKQYYDDLKKFYIGFTDNTEMPVNINKFSDIKLRDYSKKPYCNKSAKSYTGISEAKSYKDKLFLDYANNLKNMVQSVNDKQDILLSIINKMFIYVDDPIMKQQVVRINPELTENSLQDIVVDTRKIIIELYLRCETDFVEGVKLYEAIVESQIFETSKNQINSLNEAAEKLVTYNYEGERM